MRKILEIALFVLFAFSVSAPAQLLWRITGKGVSAPSYLFATHHLVKVGLLDSVPGFRPALASCHTVVCELNTTSIDTKTVAKMLRKMIVIDNDTTLHMLYTPAEYARVDSCVRANMHGLTLEKMNKIRPVYIMDNLASIYYVKMGGDYSTGDHLDSYIQKLGVAAGMKVVALETYEQQANEMFLGTSLRCQAKQLLSLVDSIESDTRSDLKVTDCYKRQDLKEMYRLSSASRTPKDKEDADATARLLDNRNKVWMERLPQLIKEGPTFIAVGALHLMGHNGLLSLLKKRGFKVSPVH
jgi:uncharacterized protein YbaP (TraB family)